MKDKRFLYYPLVLFAVLFLLDKIFFLDIVKRYIKPDFTYIYYEAKEELFDRLVRDYPSFKGKKKLMIILGSSRLLYFDYKDLRDFYPDWEIYNFSSAVTTPAYYTYYMEKILDAGIRPDYILLEAAPNQYNENTPVFRDSNLTYSFDLPFMFRYADVFGKDLVSFYLGKTLFAVSKNKPDLAIAWDRLTHPQLDVILAMQTKIRTSLLESKGNALSVVGEYVEKDFVVLEETGRRTIDWLFVNYRFSQMQYEFLDILLARLEKEKIPLMIVKPENAPPLEKLMQEVKVIPEWKKRTQAVVEKHGFAIKYLADARDFRCNSFADGSHMALSCYHPFIRYVMSEYYRRQP